jgi:hypothetical protein
MPCQYAHTAACHGCQSKGDDDFVFHLPAHANVDAALKRIAKKVGIEKKISFHYAPDTPSAR